MDPSFTWNLLSLQAISQLMRFSQMLYFPASACLLISTLAMLDSSQDEFQVSCFQTPGLKSLKARQQFDEDFTSNTLLRLG